MGLVARKSTYQTFHKDLKFLPLYNTGQDSNGVLPDGTVGVPNWSLISVPAGSTTDLRVRRQSGGFPIPPYVGDNSTSAWIGANNNSALESPEGIYVFRTGFDLSLKSLTTAKIIGQFSVDDNLFDILINGLSTGITGSGFDRFFPFQITTGFIVGRNTLDFRVYNGSPNNNPLGFRVEMSLQI